MEPTLPTPTTPASLFLSLASALFLSCLPLSAQTPPPNPAPTAQILLTAVDATGTPAKNLTKDTTQLQIDGHSVDIRDLRPLASSPLYFSVVVDFSGSARPTADSQNVVVTRLFSLLSTADNHGYLVLFNDHLHPNDQFVSLQDAQETMQNSPAESRSGSTNLY